MNSNLSRSRFRRGMTLPELLFVVCIIAVLLSVAVVGYNRIARKAEGTACVAQMKKFYGVMGQYIFEHGTWPQEPDDENGSVSEDEVWEWWFKTTEPLGFARKDWFCPAEVRETNKKLTEAGYKAVDEKQVGVDNNLKDPSYIPAMFEAGPYEPTRDFTPWLMERGDFHEDGIYILTPGGAVEKQLSLDQMMRMRKSK